MLTQPAPLRRSSTISSPWIINHTHTTERFSWRAPFALSRNKASRTLFITDNRAQNNIEASKPASAPASSQTKLLQITDVRWKTFLLSFVLQRAVELSIHPLHFLDHGLQSQKQWAEKLKSSKLRWCAVWRWQPVYGGQWGAVMSWPTATDGSNTKGFWFLADDRKVWMEFSRDGANCKGESSAMHT